MRLINIFKNKKIIVTGHTGFKGSWMSLWLSLMEARIFGISLSVPTKPSHYSLLKLKIERDIRIDISNTEEIKKIISDIKPDFIFHLAAQAIVVDSFHNPINTFKSNTLGTASLLDALRFIKNKCVVVMITSDKSYDNIEIKRGYHENDKLGGSDPYSGSKGAAELIISSYVRSFFHSNGNIKLGIARAGNVIGGGDWASNRIIPDIIKAIEQNKKLKIRSPNATRPWQHVLEPISGYLYFAADLMKSDINHGEAFNFGPSSIKDYTVEQVLVEMKNYFSTLNWEKEVKKEYKESTLLKLDCTKAIDKLSWKANLNFKETISFTSNWYLHYFENKNDIVDFSKSQIIKFQKLANNNNNKWAQN